MFFNVTQFRFIIRKLECAKTFSDGWVGWFIRRDSNGYQLPGSRIFRKNYFGDFFIRYGSFSPFPEDFLKPLILLGTHTAQLLPSQFRNLSLRRNILMWTVLEEVLNCLDKIGPFHVYLQPGWIKGQQIDIRVKGPEDGYRGWIADNQAAD